MNIRTKGIAVYLLIAFGLAWIPWEVVIRHGISVRSPMFQFASLPIAFAPAFAAFVVRKWITREGFADAGLRLNLSTWRYYLVGWLLPLVVVACIVVMAPLLGMGRADLSMARGVKAILPPGTPVPHLPTVWIVAAGLTLFSLPGALASFGEEFGWRSYLQMRLFPQQPVLSAVVTGLIWSLWHFPVLIRGYAFPDNPYSGLIAFSVSAVLLSIIFGWLRLKTGSIWSSSLAHAATNAVGGNLTVFLFAGGASLLWVSNLGILAWIPLGALSAWIVFTGQLNPAVSLPSQTESACAIQASA
jgi:membrane protease YdiL (CAAX protease family)